MPMIASFSNIRQLHGANLSWTDISPSLMAATVLCQVAVTHALCVWPLTTRERTVPSHICNSQSPKTVSRPSAPPHLYPYGHHDLCHQFNRGWCHSIPCRFQHACSNCFKPSHPEHSCPDARGKQKGGCPPSADVRRPPSQQHPSMPKGKPR